MIGVTDTSDINDTRYNDMMMDIIDITDIPDTR